MLLLCLHMFTKWQLGQGRQRWAPNPQWWIRRRRWYADRGFIHGSMGESMMDLLDTWWYMGIEWNLMELGDYLSPCVFGLYDIEVWKWYISPIPTNDHDFCRWKTLIKLRYLGVYPIFNIKHRNQYCNRCGFILWLWLNFFLSLVKGSDLGERASGDECRWTWWRTCVRPSVRVSVRVDGCVTYEWTDVWAYVRALTRSLVTCALTYENKVDSSRHYFCTSESSQY